MITVRAMNVNDAYISGMLLLASNHEIRPTRNGPALVCPEPVATRYAHPRQRVLFFGGRDANPFFHLFEALWMLNGERDITIPAYFVPSVSQYSDDGQTFNAAYGYRWREHFGFDQLDSLVGLLAADPWTRRAVLAMWEVTDLVSQGSADLPCNTLAKFDVRKAGGQMSLCMTVFNRSNDIIWGCYGANVVQFSMLQEYMAARLGLAVGWYEQISSDFHAYQDQWQKHWPSVDEATAEKRMPINPYLAYSDGAYLVQPVALVHDAETFDTELSFVMDAVRRGDFAHYDCAGHRNLFFRVVAQPMYQAYRLYRGGDPVAGAMLLEDQMARAGGRVDWLVAGAQWLRRRKVRDREVALPTSLRQG